MTRLTSARRPWRLWKSLAVVLLVIIALLAALPWSISRGPFRSRVVAGLDRAMAPGRLQFDELHLSWFGPTRLTGVVVRDPVGEAVIKVPSASFDQPLGRLILGARGPAVLTLDGASLEVERASDGSINIVDALRAVLARPDPDRDVTIRVVDGSIRYRDPFLAEPAVADSLDVTIRAPLAPGQLTWSAKLGRGDASIEVQGDFDAWLSKGGSPRTPELQIGVVGKRWPFVARTAGLDASGKLDGSLDFARKRGRWVLSGDARLIGFNARGKLLEGDTLALDRVEAGWDLAEAEEGWTIRRLSAVAGPGQVKLEGQLNGPGGSGKQRIEGRVDLAEIARQLPHALRLRDGLAVDRGTARIAVDLESHLGQSTCEVEAKVSDLSARDHDRPLSLKDPATFNARLILQGGDSLVERLSVHTSFLDGSAKGRLVEGVALEATIDLGGLRKQLGEWFDLGQLDLAGRADLSGTYRMLPSGVPDEAEEAANVALNEPVMGPDTSVRPARYVNRLQVNFRDLRVESPGFGPIRRDSASLRAFASGPTLPTGLPLDWKTFTVQVQSGGSEARIGLESRAETTGVFASVWLPVLDNNQARVAQIRLAGERSSDRRQFVIDTLSLSLDKKGAPPSSRMAATVHGRLDLSSGELTLESKSVETTSIRIEPEGLRISGLGNGLESLRVDGGLLGDLAGIDQLIADVNGRSPMGLSGRWSALGNARGDSEGLNLSGRLSLVEPPNPVARATRPTALALRAHYSPRSDRLDLTEFTATTSYGSLDASGRLEAASGERRVDLKGVLAPDFAAINALLVARVEPGSHLEGKPRVFRAAGSIGGEGSDGWKGLEAEFGFDLDGADIYGMKFGPSPVVLRVNRGKLSFDPIGTTLNEGHVRLEPEVDLDAPAGPVLRLAKNSSIREARINDEVSRRVLAYAAPILDQATRASGLVSVDLDHAEFPIGPGRARQAKVEGAVIFKDVEFAPGPLAGEILGAIGRRDLTLKIDQPVTLTVADGRVNQRGMTIPVGGFTQIELNGWVDFDRKIAINASVPVTPAMLGNNPLLSDIIAGTKVRLPIGGTLDRPVIDKDAFSANIQDLGKSLLTRGATRGAMELLMRLARPKDPDAPPPPSAEERKAMRQQKKAIRRGETPPPPADDRRP